jgi:hypothetical protein
MDGYPLMGFLGCVNRKSNFDFFARSLDQ